MLRTILRTLNLPCAIFTSTRRSLKSRPWAVVKRVSSVWRRRHSTLLLLDYCLPDMNGLEVLKQLAQTDRQLTVVLVTSDGDEALVVNDYVAKGGAYLDTFPDLLHDAVKRHADKHSLGLPVGTEPRLILFV